MPCALPLEVTHDSYQRSDRICWMAEAATASSPFLNRLNIRRRLTLCFIFIIVLMLIGNGVLLWQLHLISAQVERLNGVNEELIEVLRVHTGLLSAYERLVLRHSRKTLAGC